MLPLRRFHRWRRADARRPLADLPRLFHAQRHAWTEAVPAFALGRSAQALDHEAAEPGDQTQEVLESCRDPDRIPATSI